MNKDHVKEESESRNKRYKTKSIGIGIDTRENEIKTARDVINAYQIIEEE